ncbi:MAG: hypothetical protein ABIO88_12385 [Burkholderiaceae bacterium]
MLASSSLSLCSSMLWMPFCVVVRTSWVVAMADITPVTTAMVTILNLSVVTQPNNGEDISGRRMV